MKIKVISRSDSSYLKERQGDIDRVDHNLNPILHPFERAREVCLLSASIYFHSSTREL